MDDLERYIERHVTPEDPLLAELDRETHLRVVQPRMISGHLQGRLLEMVVRMICPQRILEIGTFTGYSAICMARGLGEGGELHTIEANDELEPIARDRIEIFHPQRAFRPHYAAHRFRARYRSVARRIRSDFYRRR